VPAEGLEPTTPWLQIRSRWNRGSRSAPFSRS